MRTPSSGREVSGKSGPEGGSQAVFSPGESCAAEWEANQGRLGSVSVVPEQTSTGGAQEHGRAPGWSWHRVVGDLRPSAAAKILLPSDVANQFTGVVHFVLSHNKPLIPGLETDLDSVCAVCGSAGLFCCAWAQRILQQESAGEGVRAALKN